MNRRAFLTGAAALGLGAAAPVRKARLFMGRPSWLGSPAQGVPGWHPRLKALPIALPNTRAPIGLIALKSRMLTPLAQLLIANVRTAAKAMVQGA